MTVDEIIAKQREINDRLNEIRLIETKLFSERMELGSKMLRLLNYIPE